MNIYRVNIQFEDGSGVSLDNLTLDPDNEARSAMSLPYGRVVHGRPLYEIDEGFEGERREELIDAVAAFIRKDWR